MPNTIRERMGRTSQYVALMTPSATVGELAVPELNPRPTEPDFDFDFDIESDNSDEERDIDNVTDEEPIERKFNSIKEEISSINNPNDKQVKCFLCNNENNVRAVFFKRTNYKICDDCIVKHLKKCNKCNGVFSKDHVYKLGDNCKNYCSDCLMELGFRICHNCKDWKPNIIQIHNDYSFCEECIGKLNIEVFHCRGCGRHYHKDRYGKNNYCITCINSELREVRNYSYKPEPRFFKVNSEMEELYFGVELEMGYVEDPHTVNEFVAEYSNNFFYMKKDTSIPIYGCEIVTQPATLKKHIGSRYWKPLLEASKEYGFSADNNKCGIHVHVSKNFFNEDELSKLDCFVNSYDFWKRVARRESHYSEYIHKDEDSWGRQTTNRRCALNLSNEQTVEFRIFQGTLEYEEIMAYLEVCHAASVFVKTCTCDIMDVDEKNKKHIINSFVNFVNHSKYLYLPKYFNKFKVFQ